MANGESTSYRLERLEETTRDHERRIRENREALMALPYLTEDLAEIRKDCGRIRDWVEERERARKDEEKRKESISAVQLGAILGGVAIVIAAMIQALSPLLQ